MLDARTTSGVHEAEVARLVQAYAAMPPGAPVRLAKRTSNLFRFRDARRAHGRARRLRVRPRAVRRPGTRTADVRGMTTYEDLVDATLPHGLMPLVVPAAQDDHPRRRGDRARHRVDVVPQRPAARVGARAGDPHRRRAGRHRHAGQRARRPVPRLPQLLRHARLRAAAARSSSSRSRPYVRLRHVRFDDRRRAASRRWPRSCADAARTTASRSTSSTAPCSRRTSCT